MNLWNTSSQRLLCAERLESRRLLSAVAPDVEDIDDVDDEPAAAEEADASPVAEPEDADESPEVPHTPVPVEADADDELEGAVDEEDDDEIDGALNDEEDEVGEPEIPVTEQPAPIPPPPAPLVNGPTPTSPASEPTPVATPTRPERTGTVRIIKEEVEDDAEDDVEVDLAELPAAVRAAVESLLPGAELTEAEVGIDDEGEEPEYGITAEFSGELIEVAVTADGEIVETERLVDAEELPQAIVDEVRRAHPDAEIDEAAVVTSGGEETYEVLLSRPGQLDLESTLAFLDDAPTPDVDGDPEGPIDFIPIPPEGPTAAEEGDGTSGGIVAADGSGAAGDEQSSDEADVASEDVARVNQDDQDEARAQDRRRANEKDDEEVEAIDFTARAGTTLSAPVAEALLRAVVRGDAPVEWVPQIAGALSNVLPVDPSAVEHGMRRVLERIDALSTRVTGDTAAGRGLVRVTLVAALLIGAKLLLLESKKSKGGPTVVFNSADSTWSWVIGRTPPTTARRRTTSSRQERP